MLTSVGTYSARHLRLAALCLALTSALPVTWAKPIPANLGYGLDKLVESDLTLRESAAKGAKPDALYNGYATPEAASYAASAISSEDGRFLVDITLNGRLSFDEVRSFLATKFSSLEIEAAEPKYHGVGIIEAWVSIEEAAALAKADGVSAVFLAHKPRLSGAPKTDGMFAKGKDRESPSAPPGLSYAMLGTKFMQGVTQHRVDKINQFYNPGAPVNYDGEGITVGVLSDSFNRRTTNTSTLPNYQTNFNNFDLPGHPNNPINKTPVAVLDDPTGTATDEGRGMCEIVYKMAPKARIGFAQAGPGEVGFASNIKALSGAFPEVPHTLAGFKADVITDDVSYGGEPVFSDSGVIANAIDDVAALGISYFSSAANSYGVSVYNSDLRIVPNGTGLTAADGNTALANTNIDLTGVPTNLYQGGFHNFNPNGQDIACLWNVSNGAAIEMQWDDPYDYTPANLNQPPIYTATGTITDNTVVTYTDVPPLMAGTRYVITETATSGNFDGIVSVIDANNVTIVDQDTGTDETVTFFPPTSGQYKIAVRRFGTTSGSYSLTVNTANGSPSVTTDLNMLAFRADNGAYVGASSLTSNNIANNRPVELGSVVRPTGQTQLQFVIARAFTPTAPRPATHVRLGTDANSDSSNAPAEYFDYNATVTGGHNTAAGCNGVAAYSAFRPNVPQNFTSAGPALIYFDRNNNRLATPEVRLQPRLAATNGANSTWGTSADSLSDIDTGNAQFGGTSAAAPHAAAIAALVLQAHGGSGSVTPGQMTNLLERSTFAHDLDPYVATGVARATNGGKVTVTVRSDNTAVQNRGRNDANSHAIAYIGPSSITEFKFNPSGLPAEGGAVTSGQNGVDASNNYFSNVTPGMYFTNLTATGNFPFTFGASTGLNAADVTMALSNPAPLPAGAVGQGQTLTLTFAPGSFTGGDIMRFTIGRGIDRGPDVTTTPNGSVTTNFNADLFGGGVLIPEGTVIPDGMRFSGTLADGSTFDGRMKNRLGSGFSNLDGFGFINAEAAVTAPIQ